MLASDAALYGAALWLLAATSSPVGTILGWVLAANAISALFVVGHDAAHESLFKSRHLNRLAGQLAMLPSLHAQSVWAYGHNKIHHAFACCQGLDFVWHPVSPQEYRAYSALGRLRHRIEWSAIGSGFYYARTMWMGKIVQGTPPGPLRWEFARDRAIVFAYAIAFALCCAYLGWREHSTIGGAVWGFVELFAVPWMLWNVMIGWAVYVHHIHPSIAWRRRREWSKLSNQLEGATTYKVPRWINVIWHNIFEHTAHHLDPRIPFYHLPAASAALERRYGDLFEPKPYRLRDYVEATRRCKLFDFERGEWLDYRGRGEFTREKEDRALRRGAARRVSSAAAPVDAARGAALPGAEAAHARR